MEILKKIVFKYIIVIITGFSGGGGKTFFSKKIVESESDFEIAVSTTTRKPRTGEVDGVDYNFVSVEEFLLKIKNQEFLEWNSPAEGIYYGSTVAEYARIVEKGKVPVFEVDCAGALKLINGFGDDCRSVFLDTSDETRTEWMNARGDMSPKRQLNRLEQVKTAERPLFEKNRHLFSKVVENYGQAYNLLMLIQEVVDIARVTKSWDGIKK